MKMGIVSQLHFNFERITLQNADLTRRVTLPGLIAEGIAVGTSIKLGYLYLASDIDVPKDDEFIFWLSKNSAIDRLLASAYQKTRADEDKLRSMLESYRESLS